jgi:hypothetical protein
VEERTTACEPVERREQQLVNLWMRDTGVERKLGYNKNCYRVMIMELMWA